MYMYNVDIHDTYVILDSGGKVTTLQPENRQEQDVIYYFKI